MAAYALRRLIWAVPILLGICLMLFVLLQVLPGDPAQVATGDHRPSEQTLENLRGRFNLNSSLPVQFYDYISGLFRGDLGDSYQTRQPVNEIIGATLPNSLRLAFLALAIELLVGIPAGALAAIKKDRSFDRGSLLLTALLIAMPVFLLGLGFQLLFSIRLGWMPVAGLGDGSFRYHLMPAAVMGLIAAAYLARVVRSNMLEILSSEYILAARANGLPEFRIVFIHALKNAMPQILALAGLHFGVLIGSAVATETVFNWPGLGKRLYTAILYRDRPLIVGATLSMAMLIFLINLIVDMAQSWLNPRVRLTGRGRLDV